MGKGKTSMNDLRDHLFETIERLLLKNDNGANDKEKIDVETAKAIADVAQVAVNAAKVEVEALKIIAGAENRDLATEAVKNMSVLRLIEPS
jgi:hypothetical protein